MFACLVGFKGLICWEMLTVTQKTHISKRISRWFKKPQVLQELKTRLPPGGIHARGEEQQQQEERKVNPLHSGRASGAGTVSPS